MIYLNFHTSRECAVSIIVVVIIIAGVLFRISRGISRSHGLE